MLNSSSIIESQRKLLCKTELPSAKCIHLSTLLEMLAKDKKISPIMAQWDCERASNNQKAHDNAEKSIEWIREKLIQLKLSKWIDHPIVKDTLELAETLIFCKMPPSDLLNDFNKLKEYNRRIDQLTTSLYPKKGFIGLALNALDTIALILAEFGEVDLFEGWAELESVEGRIPINQILPEFSAKQLKSMSLSEISEKTGFGFFEIKIVGIKKNTNESFFFYRQKRLIHLILPECIESSFEGLLPKSLVSWTESRDTDPVTLLHFLKILGGYKYYTEQVKETSPPYNWEDLELMAVQQGLKEYFRPFSSLDSKVHPIASNKINDLVDIFLNMIEIRLLSIKDDKPKKHSHKATAKTFIVNTIKGLLPSKIDQSLLKSNMEMHMKLIEIAQKRGELFVAEMTFPLVSNVYRKVLKEKGITRKGGAPLKNNLQKKKKRKFEG